MEDEEQDIVDWLEAAEKAVGAQYILRRLMEGEAYASQFRTHSIRLSEAANEIRKLRELVETKAKTG